MMYLKREPNNCWDKCAIATVYIVKANSTTAGHILYNLALLISPLLARGCNKGTNNKGCVYRLYRPSKYTQQLKRAVVTTQRKITVVGIHLALDIRISARNT